MKKIFFISTLLSFLNPVMADETGSTIADGMRGLTTESCVKLVHKVENKWLAKKLPRRTHPVVHKTDPKNNAFSATAIVDYKGDNSQVNITAIPIGNSCNVIYMETFVRKDPCAIVRQNIFKKWNYLGKLKDTMAFTFRRDDQYFGYLTPQGFNSACLISKRRVYYGKID